MCDVGSKEYPLCVVSELATITNHGIKRTVPSKAGTVANTANAKKMLMIIGPLFGSALKI